jgi:teichuronic acid biosynthesis glycosyltransferase TuaH
VSDLVVCSLEPWDDVWRRNQVLVDGLLRRDPELRVLFVEPPSDLVHGVLHGQLPADPRLRRLRDRLWALRPLKPLPRRAGSWADRALVAQVRRAARRLGFSQPTLWVNDSTYAPLAGKGGWPTLYDVTDDWLLTRASARELTRRRRLEEEMLRVAREVVVCSPTLVESRGRSRRVSLVPNGVDVDHFRLPRPRPADLPPYPTAVYVGTLHDERIDVPLVEDLARSSGLTVVLVGPDALSAASRRALRLAGVRLLGPRPYADVPAYLQHADVVIVPHLVTPFTESLDPIKAYECLAAGRPTVATPVAGFRGLDGAIDVVPREVFARAVDRALVERREAAAPPEGIDWEARVAAFESLLPHAADAVAVTA